MRKLALVLMVSLAFLIGCGGGGGGGGGSVVTNPAAPVAPLPPAEDPAVVPDPVGNSTISTTITLPGVDTSLRAVSTSKYATGKLYVDGVLFQTVAVDFAGSSATLTFTGVKDSGVAKLDVELTGCSIYGVTSFTKTGNISNNLTLTVEPIYPAGSIVTSDNRMLTEVGTPVDGLGRVISGTLLSFNDLGQPIGQEYGEYAVNFITNQKLFDASEVIVEERTVSLGRVVWYNGKFISAQGEMVFETNPATGETKVMMGKWDNHTPTVDGVSVSDATFETIRDLQVINNTLYIHGSFSQVIKLNGGTLDVITTQRLHDGFSITEDGEIFLLNYSDGVNAHVAKLIGTEAVIQSQFDDPAIGGIGVSNLIKYQDGYLYGVMGKVLFIRGTTVTTWLDTAAIKGTSDDTFSVYKNHLGEVYVISEEKHKIWKLN